MTTSHSLFDVDANGLRQLVARKGYAFILFELWQNIRDSNARNASLDFRHISGQTYEVRAEDDDPEGFSDLSHSYTLFAPSLKKGDSTKSGMFNLGEKLVIATCQHASIETTRGTVRFGPEGRQHSRRRRDVGSLFTGRLRLTREEYDAAIHAFDQIIVGPDVALAFNGRRVPHDRDPVEVLSLTLPTPVPNDEGLMRLLPRKADVELYVTREGEVPLLYEHGIPVCPSNSRWHYNVRQKVPVPMERDSVTPGYLDKIHLAAVNARPQEISPQDVSRDFVVEAVASPHASHDAVLAYRRAKYGEKAVVFDPSDREANKRAVSQGYVVIHGGAEPTSIHENFRRFSVARPAGQVTPSPKPYSPDGAPLQTIPIHQWSEGMHHHAAYARLVFKAAVTDEPLHIRFANEVTWPFLATFGSNRLTFNIGRLGRRWFAQPPARPENASLMIHEFGHHVEMDHLSANYYRALTDIGGALHHASLIDPSSFEPFLAAAGEGVAAGT